MDSLSIGQVLLGLGSLIFAQFLFLVFRWYFIIRPRYAHIPGYNFGLLGDLLELRNNIDRLYDWDAERYPVKGKT